MNSFSKLKSAETGTRHSVGIVWTASLLLVMILGSGCFRVSRDTAALRDSVMAATGSDWGQKFEAGLGTLTLGAARMGLSYADLPPEAQVALQSVRGADVAVYEAAQLGRRSTPRNILDSGDRAMTARGWERIVAVVQDRQLVAVYVPVRQSSERDVRVCVLVLDKRQLVVVSAKSDLAPLMALAMNRPELRANGKFALEGF